MVIDPIRTVTADRADRFVQLRPGTDTALVLGLIHVMARDGMLDESWLTERTTGWAELRASAEAWTPDRTAAVTDVDAATIEWLARALTEEQPAAVRSLVGPEHRQHGSEIMRAIALIPAVTGSWRHVGGGLCTSTQIWWEDAFGLDEGLADPPRRFNMARLGEVLTDAGLDPPIRSLFVYNSNPAVIVPDQNRVMEGLARDDLFTVVVEQFMTDTALHADLVLPATTQLEHLDIGPGWGHFYITPNLPAIEPLGEALPNAEIFRRLATAMGLDDPGLQESDESVIRSILDRDHSRLEGVDWDQLVADGWARFDIPRDIRPHTDRVFRLGTLEHHDPPGASDACPLQLISLKQHSKFLNANYAQFERHLPHPPEPRLEIDATDAATRGIAEGDRVRVRNERGSLTLTATISDRVQPGLTAIPFGWWHRHTPEGRAVNALTNPSIPSADDTGSAAFHDTWVDVEPT